MKRATFLLVLIVSAAVMIRAQSSSLTPARPNGPAKETTFTVRVENISSPDGYTASNGMKWPFALSPGMWVVDPRGIALFKEGKPAPANGLESQAEDGNPSALIKSINGQESSMFYGVFNTPVGAMGPGPIVPGGAFEFTFKATPKMKLNMAMMFGQSNDLFYSPTKPFDLFDSNGQPITGDITSKFMLWDAGTETDQEPGIGPDQAPRQKAPNTGAAENSVVRRATDVSFFNQTGHLLRITIRPVM